MPLASLPDSVSPPSRTVAAVLALVAGAQLLLLAIYLHVLDVQLRLFHLYPIVWITVGSWALWRIRPEAGTTRRHVLAGGVALGYLLLIGYLGGLFGPGYLLATTGPEGEGAAFIAGARFVELAPPGYAPAIMYVGAYVSVALIPYLVVGYLSLSYLVYVTIIDAWRASAPGALGAFACVGCSWPVLASLATGVGGLAGSVAAGAYSFAYPLSTAAYLLAVGLLVWRPGIGAR